MAGLATIHTPISKSHADHKITHIASVPWRLGCHRSGIGFVHAGGFGRPNSEQPKIKRWSRDEGALASLARSIIGIIIRMVADVTTTCHPSVLYPYNYHYWPFYYPICYPL